MPSLAVRYLYVPSRVDIHVRSHSRRGGQPRFRTENGRIEEVCATGAEAENAALLNGMESRPWFQAVANFSGDAGSDGLNLSQ